MSDVWTPREGEEVYCKPLDMFGKLTTIVGGWYHVVLPNGERVCRLDELEPGEDPRSFMCPCWPQCQADE